MRFDVHSAKTYPAEDYDLVCFFDCLHDMGDPVGAMTHAREAMAADGTCMLVEPFAHDRLEDNLNPVGRVYYAASTMVCTPASLDQEVGMALGAQAGEARLRDVAQKAGLKRFRRATETAFNLILEARVLIFRFSSPPPSVLPDFLADQAGDARLLSAAAGRSAARESGRRFRAGAWPGSPP